MPIPNVLILGGTSEARTLAENWPSEIKAIISYAGVTSERAPVPLKTRVGGFGGVQGLIDYLSEHQITHVIDATHPYAVNMTHHAVQATRALNIALIRLSRPAWQKGAQDHWISVPTLEKAACELSSFQSGIFITSGLKDLSAFLTLKGKSGWVRVLPGSTIPKLPDGFKAVETSPPYEVGAEYDWMKENQITVLVTKNSGGTLTHAKIVAARRLGLCVIMVDRPPVKSGVNVESVDDVLKMLKRETQPGP